RPPKWLNFAAFGSTWKYCGSYSRPKRMISSSVKSWLPRGNTSSMTMSSNQRVIDASWVLALDQRHGRIAQLDEIGEPHAHHRLAPLVADVEIQRDDAAFGVVARAAQAGDRCGAADGVADHHRLFPLEVGKAEATHRGDGVEEAVAEHPEAQRRRLPARGGEAAQQRSFGGRFVEMERERIELAREGDYHLLAHGGRADIDHLADGKVFVMPAVLRNRVHRALTYTSTCVLAASAKQRAAGVLFPPAA